MASQANRALGGAVPIDQLDTDLGAKEVENILGRIAYGVYSNAALENLPAGLCG